MTRRSYRDIRDEVLRRIRDRDWPPGAVIPSEPELAAEFGCARGTVHRALGELAEAGVLERRRRAGTRVAAVPVRRATLAIPILRQEVEATGAAYRHRLLLRRRERPPAHLAARMNLAPGGGLVRLGTLHLADDRPFAHEARWINPAAVPALAQAPFERISANEWLVRNVPYSAGDLAFSAEAAQAEEAAALGIVSGAPVFVLDRLTWAGTEAVTLVRLAYAPGYRMRMRI